jgi:hypothetical protein
MRGILSTIGCANPPQAASEGSHLLPSYAPPIPPLGAGGSARKRQYRNGTGHRSRDVILRQQALSFPSILSRQLSSSFRSPRLDSSFTLSHSAFRSFWLIHFTRSAVTVFICNCTKSKRGAGFPRTCSSAAGNAPSRLHRKNPGAPVHAIRRRAGHAGELVRAPNHAHGARGDRPRIGRRR